MNELHNDCFYPLTVKELQNDMIVQEGDILIPVIWMTLCFMAFNHFLDWTCSNRIIRPECLALSSQEDRNAVKVLWLDATVPYTISKDLGRSWFLQA